MKIFETHAHYDDERFDEDRDELISSMLSDTGELDYIVNVGASRQGCEASLALAAQYEGIRSDWLPPGGYCQIERIGH